MFNKQKKIVLIVKILKLILFSPLLISIPFTNNNFAKAGLEFQWDQNTGYKRLKWFQKDGKRRSRNSIFFFLRPSDRKEGILKVTLKIPKNFKSNLDEKVSLCKVKIGGFESNTKCIEDIPIDIEINEENTNEKYTSLDLFPYNPIPSNKESYAIVFKNVINPSRSGLYQFHSLGQYFGKNPSQSYFGSWTIVIN